MAMKADVQINLDFGPALEKVLENRSVLENVADNIVKDAKRFISKGTSPVRSEGRFAGYKADRARGETGRHYPYTVIGKYPGKQVRPVNLKLDGTYLKHYTWWLEKDDARLTAFIGLSAVEGFYSTPPEKILKMFETHNEGTHPHVPQRKHLPTAPNESFNVTIERNATEIIRRAIEAAIEKMDK